MPRGTAGPTAGRTGGWRGGGGRGEGEKSGGGTGGEAVTGGCAAAPNGLPHLTQNFTASGIEAPHAGQVRPATAAGGMGG